MSDKTGRPRHAAMEDETVRGVTYEKAVSAERRTTAPKAVMRAFLAICAILLILPSVGMLWAPTTETTENRVLAPLPRLSEDGKPNANFLSDLGAYFEDHFAYRNDFVTANSRLRAALGSSPTESVVIGDDGWLFYGGTLHDFTGEGRLTEREIENLAFNFSLIQGYCESQGADFCVAVVPNKNSVYPEEMPYFYGEAAKGSTLNDLYAALDKAGVSSVDLYSLLLAQSEKSDDPVYYKLDTHWNQAGALAASKELLNSLGAEASANALGNLEPDAMPESHVGDLDEMLFPSSPDAESAPSYVESLNYRIVVGANEIDTDASAWIEANGGGDGVLYMFRDSFAQNMIPFLASSFSTSYYDWYVPYDYTKIIGRSVTDVVVEKAERSLGDLAENPGIMPAPTVDVDASLAHTTSEERYDEANDGVSPSVRDDGSMKVIEGTLPSFFEDQRIDELFVAVEGLDKSRCYVPFRVTESSNPLGYRAYVFASDYPENAEISVLVKQGDRIIRAY